MRNRRSLAVRVGRFLQSLPLSWLRAFESPLISVRASRRNEPEPVLLILLGLPRSGSTLTYQCLIHSLKPVYLSNVWNLLYSTPLFGGILSDRLCNGYQSDFSSSHGFVEGLCGPAEGLCFWSYWTGCGLNERFDDDKSPVTVDRRLRYLKRSVDVLTSSSRPMVTGYLGHVLVAEQLRVWFPKAIFVRLHRDPLSNASSILRSRFVSNTTGWFSVFPRECLDVLEEDIYYQVASQVYWLNRRLSAFDDDPRTLHLAYEDLCQNPRGQVERIVDFCNRRGMQLRTHQKLPRSFQYQLVSSKASKNAHKLTDALRELNRTYG